MRYQFATGPGGVLTAKAFSDVVGEGFTEVSPEVYDDPAAIIGACTFDGAKCTPLADPPAPFAVPVSVSPRQLFQKLATMGRITQEEAIAFMSVRALPVALEAFVGALPAAQRFDARMLLIGASSFERAHPLTLAMGEALGFSSGDLDALWIDAAALV